MWEKSRLICSSLRELQEEHRKGVLSFTMHKAPIGASECRLTSRRGLVPGYWTLSGQQVGEQYLQVEPLWFVLFLYLFWIFFFCIQRSLKPNGSSKLVLGQALGSVCGYVEMSWSGQDGPYHSNLYWVPYHRPLSCILWSLGLPIMLRHWNEKPSKLHLCTTQLHGEGFLGKNAARCLHLPAGALGLLQHLQCPCSNSRLAGAEPAGAMVCAAGQESMGRSRGKKNSILAPRFLL